MSQLPTDWLEKLFQLMTVFYGERWSLRFIEPIILHKTIWYNSLRNLSYEQIKQGLIKSKELARIKFSNPPTNIEFYHWCLKIEYKKIEKKKYYYVPRRT